MQNSSTTRRVFGPARAVSLAFGDPSPLLAYAVPSALAAAVAGGVATTVAADDLSIVNHAPALVAASPSEFVGAAAFTVVLALAQAFGLTAATSALLARVDGRRLSARAAWARAARRPGAVAIAAAVSLVAASVLLLVSILLSVQPVLGIVAAIVLLIAVIVLAPLALAWPLLVAGTHPIGAALAAGWRSPRAFQGRAAEPLGSPRFALVFTAVSTGIIVLVIGWLASTLPPGWWTPVVTAGLALVSTAVVQVLLSAVAVRGAALRSDAPLTPDEGAVGAERSPARTGRGGMLPGVAVLLAPAVFAGALVALNPWQVPAFAAADVHRVWTSPQIVGWQGGSVLLSRLGGEDATVRACDDDACGPVREMASILPSAIASAADGGVLSASWIPVEGADDSSGSFELRVTHSSTEQLAEWSTMSGASGSDDAPERGLPGEVRTLSSVEAVFEGGDSVFARSNESRMAVAVDSRGALPVIASVIRPPGSGDDATLALDFCADAECSSSDRTELSIEWALSTTNATTLDVVGAEDGESAAVTLVQREADGYGSPLRLLTATVDGAWTVETLDASGGDATGGDATADQAQHDFDFAYGAQVERGADGSPVILSRARGSDVLRLFSCADEVCADAVVTEVAQHLAFLHIPAFVIDASGRPLIGTIDRDANVALVSCDDEACRDRTAVPLTGLAPSGAGSTGGFALSVDDRDRPLLAVGARRSASTAPGSFEGTILTCAAARCGGS
ncbi:hypothetical protein [Microbacterium sp. NPDC087868]|uniref:hypothetical protein n=1 Tax=Microbacterium sp. NPDC087868 TaxID=3364195 RepID=UPI00384B2CB4